MATPAQGIFQGSANRVGRFGTSVRACTVRTLTARLLRLIGGAGLLVSDLDRPLGTFLHRTDVGAPLLFGCGCPPSNVCEHTHTCAHLT
eukprot:1642407-Pyramimonas_sp.AAC.1